MSRYLYVFVSVHLCMYDVYLGMCVCLCAHDVIIYTMGTIIFNIYLICNYYNALLYN